MELALGEVELDQIVDLKISNLQTLKIEER